MRRQIIFTTIFYNNILRQKITVTFYDEIYDNDNMWLRVSYMLDDIDEFRFKKELQRRDKLREKNRDIRNIHQMFIDTAGDILRQYVLNPNEYKKLRSVLLELVEYVNREIRKIHNRYNCVVPHILETRH